MSPTAWAVFQVPVRRVPGPIHFGADRKAVGHWSLQVQLKSPS